MSSFSGASPISSNSRIACGRRMDDIIDDEAAFNRIDVYPSANALGLSPLEEGLIPMCLKRDARSKSTRRWGTLFWKSFGSMVLFQRALAMRWAIIQSPSEWRKYQLVDGCGLDSWLGCFADWISKISQSSSKPAFGQSKRAASQPRCPLLTDSVVKLD